jgi:hypothetical protein
MLYRDRNNYFNNNSNKQFITTARSPVRLKETVAELLNTFPTFHVVFIRRRHRSLFWVRGIQSIPPYPVSLTSILILVSHLRLRLPRGLFLAFPQKSCVHSSSHYACKNSKPGFPASDLVGTTFIIIYLASKLFCSHMTTLKC